MSRRKKSSRVLEKAERRVAAVTSIDPKLDLGNGLTLKGYEGALGDTRKKVSEYNTLLSQVDRIYNELNASEDVLADWSERMLSGIASTYGRSSDEYEMAGGRRRQERRRRRATV